MLGHYQLNCLVVQVFSFLDFYFYWCVLYVCSYACGGQKEGAEITDDCQMPAVAAGN